MGQLDHLLTYEQAMERFEYDPLTGFLRTRKRKGRRWVTSPGTNGYLKIRGDGKDSKAFACHRIVWLLHYKQWPKGEIDHINRNRADNRIENLRDVPKHVNVSNRPDAASMTGTTWHPEKRKWKAKIQNKNKHIHIGYFNTQIEAHEAYLRVRREICGM